MIDAFARNGIGRRPLRAIADEVGTSHRMLLHHFGSRDELLVAVVEEVERRQAAVFGTLPDDPGGRVHGDVGRPAAPRAAPTGAAVLRVLLAGGAGRGAVHAAAPGGRAGLARRGRRHTGGAVDPAFARLGLAVTRGLLLDLVATDDEAGVDAAAAAFAALLRAAAPAPGP